MHHHTSMHEAAIGFLLAHQGEHLSSDRQLLVDRCAEQLQQRYEASTTAAHVVALQALGELESRGNNANVVLSQSTSFAVFLADPVTKRNYVFTAADLLRIAREQSVVCTMH